MIVKTRLNITRNKNTDRKIITLNITRNKLRLNITRNKNTDRKIVYFQVFADSVHQAELKHQIKHHKK